MTGKKTKAAFIEELVLTFPEIRDEVFDEDYLGLISLQIGCFRRFTQNAININDLETVQKCFDFVDNNLDIVEFDVENSLVISFLGKLNFDKNIGASKLLSSKLTEMIEVLKSYYSSFSKDKKLLNFLKDL